MIANYHLPVIFIIVGEWYSSTDIEYTFAFKEELASLKFSLMFRRTRTPSGNRFIVSTLVVLDNKRADKL